MTDTFTFIIKIALSLKKNTKLNNIGNIRHHSAYYENVFYEAKLRQDTSTNLKKVTNSGNKERLASNF